MKQSVGASIKVFEVPGEKDDAKGIAVPPFNLDFASVGEHFRRNRSGSQYGPKRVYPTPGAARTVLREYGRLIVRERTENMTSAYICDAIRTPFGRYGGALSSVRTDDLAALPIKTLVERNPIVDWGALDDVFYGCTNQAGEDNRNVARMALLLAGLPKEVPGSTVNRLCGSSLDAVAVAARAIKSGELDLVIAGGVESMSRAPFVISKAS